MEHPFIKSLWCGVALVALGCDASVELDATPAAPQAVAAEEPAEQPKRERVEGNKPVKQGNPSGGYLTAVAGGYRSAREEIESWPIRQEIEHYKAITGEYPKSHEEFMEKALQSKLPEVEEGYEMRYDPEDHKLWKVPIENLEDTSGAATGEE